MVPPCSDRISRVPPYSNGSSFDGYGAVTHFAKLSSLFAFMSRTAWSAFARRY